MVSYNLLHRGLYVFSLYGSTYLPYLKLGMDLYYQDLYVGKPCQNVSPIFQNICFDQFGTDWTVFTELGCALVLSLLGTLLILVQTVFTLYMCLFHMKDKDGDFLVGAEDGCCGIMAIVLSGIANDEAPKTKSKAYKRRAISRFLTIGFQVPIIVITCLSLNIISRPTAWYSEKTSVFVLLTVLMLNLTNLIENIFEVVAIIYS
ncbi:hypothetical protein HDV04_002056 [Boothiomyces sp. JEL0838]|nr:hypothetical protein HDV04_002056 [Boothiomyces sp. JEL0838]